MKGSGKGGVVEGWGGLAVVSLTPVARERQAEEGGGLLLCVLNEGAAGWTRLSAECW